MVLDRPRRIFLTLRSRSQTLMIKTTKHWTLISYDKLKCTLKNHLELLLPGLHKAAIIWYNNQDCKHSFNKQNIYNVHCLWKASTYLHIAIFSNIGLWQPWFATQSTCTKIAALWNCITACGKFCNGWWTHKTTSDFDEILCEVFI